MPLIRSNPLPAGQFSKALDLVISHLQAPGTELARYVQTWQLGRGGDKDGVDPADWPADWFPVFRLDVGGGGAEWLNQVTHKTPAQYRLTLGVAGSDCRHSLDYWEAVARRLFPGDNSLYAKLKPLGVMSHTLSLVGLARQRYESGIGQLCSGVLTLNTEFSTKY